MTRPAKRPQQCGPNNPNWKGGRTVASNGYVLVKDRDNPMADVRGYVYEHRLVKSEEVGRPLVTAEQVHHQDEVKTNNEPTNLELCASAGHHRVRHRTEERGLRRPGESNPQIACACGCGSLLYRFDAQGRPRQYVSGHNPMPSPTRDAIVAALREGPLRRRVLVERIPTTEQAIACALSKLNAAGVVERCGAGIWALREHNDYPAVTA